MLALQKFEVAEANLSKLERVWSAIEKNIPDGVVFGENKEYEEGVRQYEHIVANLPAIDGWKPTGKLPDINDIAQNRLDALDLGEVEAQAHIELEIFAPAKELREYRWRLGQKRRVLIRSALSERIDQVDADIRKVRQELSAWESADPDLEALKTHISEIDVLLGSSVKRPPRWSDLQRHLHFGERHDFVDIELTDWPSVKDAFRKSLYGENEPIPNDIADLSDIVDPSVRGSVTTKLNWHSISAEAFERLMFTLISYEKGYENPQWLMATNAPDKGRDLSVTRVILDPLAGTFRHRVIIQCRHWTDRSIAVGDLATLREQMSLWGEPRVDVLIVATTGRFTADAVQWIEKHNGSDNALRIEMWPESHLERLLAARPALIAEFSLRKT